MRGGVPGPGNAGCGGLQWTWVGGDGGCGLLDSQGLDHLLVCGVVVVVVVGFCEMS